jgi:hypothetical protein
MSGDEPLAKRLRLEFAFDRLTAAASATDHDEALRLIAAILNAVEDEFSGVPYNPDEPGSDGRMYPPEERFRYKNWERLGVRCYRQVAHATFIADNGGLSFARVPAANWERSSSISPVAMEGRWKNMSHETPLGQLAALLREAWPEADIQFSEPSAADGVGFLDFEYGGRTVAVQWHHAWHFGVSLPEEHGYGEKPDEVFVTPHEAARRISELTLRAHARIHYRQSPNNGEPIGQRKIRVYSTSE